MCWGIRQKTHYYIQLGVFFLVKCQIICLHYLLRIFTTVILTQYCSLHQHLRQNRIKFICDVSGQTIHSVREKLMKLLKQLCHSFLLSIIFLRHRMGPKIPFLDRIEANTMFTVGVTWSKVSRISWDLDCSTLPITIH